MISTCLASGKKGGREGGLFELLFCGSAVPSLALLVREGKGGGEGKKKRQR